MKKVLFAALAVLALASCKKEYTCTISGVSVTYSEENYTDAQIDAIKTSCELGGGTWKTK